MTGNFHFTQKVNKHKSIFLPLVLKKHIRPLTGFLSPCKFFFVTAE